MHYIDWGDVMALSQPPIFEDGEACFLNLNFAEIDVVGIMSEFPTNASTEARPKLAPCASPEFVGRPRVANLDKYHGCHRSGRCAR